MEEDGFRLYVYRCPDSVVDHARTSASQSAVHVWAGEEIVHRAVTRSVLTRQWNTPQLPPRALPSAAAAAATRSRAAAAPPVRRAIDNLPHECDLSDGDTSEIDADDGNSQPVSPERTIVIVNNAPPSPGSESSTSISRTTSADHHTPSAGSDSDNTFSPPKSNISRKSVTKTKTNGTSGNNNSRSSDSVTPASAPSSAPAADPPGERVLNSGPAPKSSVSELIRIQKEKEGEKEEEKGVGEGVDEMRLRNRELKKPAGAAAADDDDDDDDEAPMDFSDAAGTDDEFYSCSSDDSDRVNRRKRKKKRPDKAGEGDTDDKSADRKKGKRKTPVFEEEDSDDENIAPSKRKTQPEEPLFLNKDPGGSIHMPSDDSDDSSDETTATKNPDENDNKENPVENGHAAPPASRPNRVVSVESDEDDEKEERPSPKKRKRVLTSSDDDDDNELFAEDVDDLRSDASTISYASGDESDDGKKKKSSSKHKSPPSDKNGNKKSSDRQAKNKSEPGPSKRSSCDSDPAPRSKTTARKANGNEKGSGRDTDTISSDDSESKPKRKSRFVRQQSSGDEYKPKQVSDSDADVKPKPKKEDSDGDRDEEKEKKKKKKRRRVKVVELDSDAERSNTGSEADEETNESEEESGKKKKPSPKKKVITMRDFAKDTQEANKAEKERRARLSERQELYNQLEQVDVTGFENSSQGNKVRRVVLEYDEQTKEPLVEVAQVLANQLKPHQINGIKFMYVSTIESIKMLSTTPGSGCILAHSMGLGKTLQVISFAHTLLTNSHTKDRIKRVLVVCPKNTSRNWAQEFEHWLFSNHLTDFIVSDFDDAKAQYDRQLQCRKWQKRGGVMIIGCSLFSKLALAALAVIKPDASKKKKKSTAKKPKKDDTMFQRAMFECLLDPGADLVIVDEGHLIKNAKGQLNLALTQVKTARRVILTGTPLQNNLYEYHCMIEFVKPSLLGNRKEFMQRFVLDIQQGQSADSTDTEIRTMKRKVHVLHKLLEGCVQRCDYNVLVPYLQPKHEYVLKLRLSEVQQKIYQHYLDHYSQNKNKPGPGKGYLFNDCSILRLISCHPALLRIVHKREMERKEEAEFIDDGSGTPATSTQDEDSHQGSEQAGPSRAAPRLTRSKRREQGAGTADSPITIIGSDAWFEEYMPDDVETNISVGVKIALLFEILTLCERIGDKLIVFSQSLDTLDLIEKFLAEVHKEHSGSNLFKNKDDTPDEDEPLRNTWIMNMDYSRIDGQTSADKRKGIIKKFNDMGTPRCRLILISTKAGSLGINLVGANRCIIFDASWNPTHDVQAIYRIYRFGQNKPCYIYRFVGYGTMEQRIYERQIIKQALSCRVVDEQQIDRHFKEDELAELYKFNPEPETEEIPIVPKDRLFADILSRCKKLIIGYHVHDSLLEDRPDQNLTEEERNAAWMDFETEKDLEAQREQERLKQQQLREQQFREQQAAHAAFLAQQQQQQQQQQEFMQNGQNGGLLADMLQRIPGLNNLFSQGTSQPQPQASPQPQADPPRRGRPPGSVKFDPEKRVTLTMQQVILFVKTQYPTMEIAGQMLQIHAFIRNQLTSQEKRMRELQEKAHLFPDLAQRFEVVKQNMEGFNRLLLEYGEMQKSLAENRKRVLQQQMEAMQKQEKERLDAELDEPD